MITALLARNPWQPPRSRIRQNAGFPVFYYSRKCGYLPETTATHHRAADWTLVFKNLITQIVSGESCNAGRNKFPMFQTPRRACSVEAVILHQPVQTKRPLTFPRRRDAAAGEMRSVVGAVALVQNQGLYRACGLLI